MKTFSTFLKETFYSPVISVSTYSTDFENGNLQAVNRALTQITSEGFDTPCAALDVIRKLMASYGILLPQILHLPEPVGEEVFGFSQSTKVGSSASGIKPPQMQYDEEPDFYLYFCYNMGKQGVYEAFAVITDKQGLNSLLKAGEQV